MEHNTGRNISDNKACASGTKIQRIHEIISMIERDGDTRKDYQPERDFIVRNIVKDIRHNKELIAEIDDELRKLIPLTGYKLHTMPELILLQKRRLYLKSEILTVSPTQTSWLGLWAWHRCNSLP